MEGAPMLSKLCDDGGAHMERAIGYLKRNLGSLARSDEAWGRRDREEDAT